MVAKWKRIVPTISAGPGITLATQAKKHLTTFVRSPRAPGAGRLAVKKAFTTCAMATGGIPDRATRIAKVKECIEKEKLKTGICYKLSKSKYPPLAGKKYKYTCGATSVRPYETV